MDDGLDATEVRSATGPKGPAAAAILMLLLGEAEAASVLKHLEPDEIKTLGKAMFAVADANETDIHAALDDFTKRSTSMSTFALDIEPRIRSVMAQALGNVRADNILAVIAPQASGEVLELLRWMDQPMIARILADEHPQVGAIVLSVLTPEVAAAALEGIDEMLQADLVYRAARLSSVPAEALDDLQVMLSSYANVAQAAPKMKLGGKTEVAKIFNRMKKPSSDRILKSVKKMNRQLGEQIEEEMFIFDNLLELDNQALGIVLRSVDAAMLGLALRGADDVLVDRMLNTMSARAAMSVRDDMAERGPVKREEVEEAQKSIVAIARKLSDDGAIMLGSGGNDYV
jgi:flagellar motor switch protein FliG